MAINTTNSLKELNEPLKFSSIQMDNIETAVEAILHDNKAAIAQSLLNKTPFTWDNLIKPMEELDDRLHRYWTMVNHMNSVVNSPELRDAYNQCIPKISEYSTEISQNEALYSAILSIKESEAFDTLSVAQQTIIEHALRDFKLSGVHLGKNDKMQFAELRKDLSKLTTKFEENVLDATNAWTKHITDEAELAGLPDIAKQTARKTAKQKDLDGWMLTLEIPCYIAVMTYADSRSLREEMYRAYTTRASDQGPNAGKWDNYPVMKRILKTRKKLAQLLGYSNYAEFSLVPKMAENTTEVMTFLEELAEASYPQAVNEFVELSKFALEEYNQDSLQAWDIAYYSEKLRVARFDISQEQLRPYFPEDQALDGLFKVVHQLYGVTLKERFDFDKWHDDVRMFDLYDDNQQLRAMCYIDLYARPNKRGGAWMDDARGRRLVGSETQLPIAFITCNFNGPVEGKPALFTHDEVLTLFHEFGHGLHHMLTKVDYADAAGISGVPWDAVELPSQFFENWCWEKDALSLISKHYETGDALPESLYDKMIAAKNFQSALQMVRQLEFSLFDFRLHMEFDEDAPTQIVKILDEVRRDVCVVPVPEFNRFPNSFSHIFAGGYAAGYYSYKWAEVLSADAFSKFEENGIFDEKTGREFLHNILEKGGSEDPKKLFVDFRGREPKIDALLRHNGIQ